MASPTSDPHYTVGAPMPLHVLPPPNVSGQGPSSLTGKASAGFPSPGSGGTQKFQCDLCGWSRKCVCQGAAEIELVQC